MEYDWNQIRAFAATARLGSLSAAGRALGRAQPTLGRQIAALENAMGVALFERVGKALVLTPAGKALCTPAFAMVDQYEHFALMTEGQKTDVSGVVKITASDVAAAYFLPQVIATVEERAPGIAVEVISSDDIQDLQRREADIAVRHVRPTQPELVARLVSEDQARFYASPRYIERFGHPLAGENLGKHRFFGFGMPQQILDYFASQGVQLHRANFKHDSENGIVAWELTKSGLGIGIMSQRLGKNTPQVVEVLEDVAPLTFPVWLATHREIHSSPKIRLVFDILAEVLETI